MAYLKVRYVRYEGKKYFYKSPALVDGFNILEGENGTGKSTFANLIYYGFGGRVEEFSSERSDKHREITADRPNFVEIRMSIDSDSYTLKRFIGTNDIGVNGADLSDIFPIFRRDADQKIFSDWILEKLGIDSVSVASGKYSGRLNITDVMRLMYHNQAPDPSGIFKPIDNASFVSDSAAFREAIFEILIGKSFQEYYTALAAYREAERARAVSAKTLELFKDVSADIQSGANDENIDFLDSRLQELQSQQDRLVDYRRSLAKAPPPKKESVELAEWQKNLLASEVEIAAMSRHEAELLEEVSRLEQLKADLVSEATQLRKMMFAHEELRLFSSNTCPYCLREVERLPHKCVCGGEVAEEDYEKFFYDSAEYLTILKSRQKNVETIEFAANTVRSELDALRSQKSGLRSTAEHFVKRIHQAVTESDSRIDLQAFEAVEEGLSKVRQEIADLERQREFEARREELETALNTASSDVERLRRRVDQLAASSQTEMEEKRTAFSEIYNRMMRRTLKDCRSAAIGTDYMPIVNGGVYTEASAAVPRRLLYFATLLEMSVTDETVKFPRFLLIDTPETSGIDVVNLKAALTRLAEVVKKGEALGRHCQIILTTGIGKWPEGLDAAVFQTMHKPNERLLKVKAK